MRSLLLLVLLASVCSALAFTEAEYQSKFATYVKDFNKHYRMEDFFFRYAQFKKALDFVTHANQNGDGLATFAINKFADMTVEEFRNTHASMRGVLAAQQPARVSNINLPTPSWDWVAKGAVTPVKDQGQCGSCYSFSATGAMEGAVAIAQKKLISLSESQIVDCSGAFGNEGCSGGLQAWAYTYITNSSHGLCSEADYPYVPEDQPCKFTSCKVAANIDHYTVVTTEDDVAAHIVNQPVAIAIEADQMCFQYFTSGVLTPENCACGASLDHAVLMTGWGTLNSVDYWTVKNSWGASWGDAGYVRIKRGVAMCGLGSKMQQTPAYWNAVPCVNKASCP
jgi:C1A family cysteine protease